MPTWQVSEEAGVGAQSALSARHVWRASGGGTLPILLMSLDVPLM